MIKRACCCGLFFLLCTWVAMADASYRFMHITGRDGLPHQQISALMQDDKGMLWIGTRNGLSRYDGYTITNYFNQPDDPRSLNQNFIQTIYQDSRKRVWIGTYSGICQYQPATDDFKHYRLPDAVIHSIVETSRGQIICGGKQLYLLDERTGEFVMLPRQDSEFILSLAIDREDRLFVSTNRSIFYYDPSFSKTTQINPAYFSDFLTGSDGIVPLFFDSQGLLWVGRNGKGVMSIDLAAGTTHLYEAGQLSDGTVRVITEDDMGRTWLGTERGLTILHQNGTAEIIRQDLEDKNKLNDNAIYDILCDRDGNVWIGTYFGGINVLLKNNEQFRWVEAGYGSQNIRGKAVRKIIEPQKGKLWIATEDGGLNIYDTRSGGIRRFDRIPQLGHNIHELYYDGGTQDMWIGTFRNGLFRYNLAADEYVHYMPDSSGLPSDAIFSIKRKQDSTLWIGTTLGLRRYAQERDTFLATGHPQLDVDFVFCMLVDRDDNLWVGTRNYGLFRIDNRTDEINNWTATAGGSALKDNYIACLYQDADGRIWIGTNNGGLQYIDPEELEVRVPGNGLALFQATICSIIEDEFGRLWVSTSRGLYQFNKERSAFVYYTVQDGLPVNQFNFASSIQASDGLLYFGSVNGLISFTPKTLKEGWKPYQVHLLHLNIDNHIVDSNTSDSPLTAALDDMSVIDFTYKQSRSFSIEYAAISLANTSAINYQVKLVGVDEDWKSVGKERKFVGSNLRPGTYTLCIRANNSNDGWGQAPVKQLTFVVHPPFFLSGWAFAIYAVVAMVILWLGLKLFAIRLREKNAVRMANLEKESLEEVNKVKMDFFTTVSHELKTPLSLIMAPLKYIAQHESLSPESRERLDLAVKNTHKMVGLIDELVTFNKLESGNFQFYLEKGNPLDFIESLCSLFRENAREKSLAFYVHCENNGEEVWFSPSYVERITSNLISNAIKFTPAGGQVFVDAAITDRPDGYNYLRIEVRDTGIGIVKEELGNIFEKYYQTKRGHNANNKGWGIGLALVKKCAAIHKGSVSVESEPGKGSCFTVLFNVSEEAFDAQDKISSDKTVVPLSQYKFTVPYPERAAQAAHMGGPSPAASQSSILLVEDNEELLGFLSGLFGKSYHTYVANNGAEALDIARKYPVDLVISDVMMPKMDGNTLCRTLKEDPTTSHIPVILLTAKGDTEDVMKGYESGAEAYVPKPFDPEILELQVKNIIHMKLVQRERIGQALGSDVETASLSKFDREFIEKINKLVEENIGNDAFSIADITQTLAVSRSLLHVKMKSLLNTSMGDFIRKKRMKKACELLREGFNVSETAYKVGFADPNYFSKAFKKELGIRPTDYLNNCYYKRERKGG